ncbi:DNA glycosylase AlkZ-like family protein [Streptomyces monashensis]|uniref:DNA glycosylase AlkZ-like family protein n=1 Tax=Streptomyces monashensis TaxID=1678012 RepID=UPI003183908A
MDFRPAPHPHRRRGREDRLARRYLEAFGPVTVDDVKRWTGRSLTDTRQALAGTGAQAVELDEGTGYLLPEDHDTTQTAPPGPEPTAALLPGLDPTAMGRRHYDWYLDPDHARFGGSCPCCSCWCVCLAAVLLDVFAVRRVAGCGRCEVSVGCVPEAVCGFAAVC